MMLTVAIWLPVLMMAVGIAYGFHAIRSNLRAGQKGWATVGIIALSSIFAYAGNAWYGFMLALAGL